MEREDDEKVLVSVLRRRSKIVEIIATEHILLALTFSGLCVAFSRSAHLVLYSAFLLTGIDSKARICIVNVSPEEVIRSVFWNKENGSLFTISVSRSDSRSLQCRSTLLAYVAEVSFMILDDS